MTGNKSGRFIAVVGPSGVGKDSVMEAMAAAQPQIKLARRWITRPTEAGGEAFDGISETKFSQLRDANAFALWWPAHELHYAIRADVDDTLAQGFDVLANLSRSVLSQADKRFEHVLILSLVADPKVLKSRLQARGREDAQDINRRLRRVSTPMPADIETYTLDNSGTLETTVTTALRHLYPERA